MTVLGAVVLVPVDRTGAGVGSANAGRARGRLLLALFDQLRQFFIVDVLNALARQFVGALLV